MKKIFNIRLIAVLLVMSLVAAACGGDDSGDSPTTTAGADDGGGGSGLEGTLRVLVHSQEPMTGWVESFSDDFETTNPGVTVDVSVVSADDLATVTQTRLSANDVDVIDIFGFANPVEDYMVGATPAAWQQIVEAGLLLDITDESFVQNYDTPSIEQAGSYNGRVYAVNLGRTVYGGMFTNLDLLAEVGVDVPTTWSELVSVCQAVVDSGNECMTHRRSRQLAAVRGRLRAPRFAVSRSGRHSSRASGPEPSSGTTPQPSRCGSGTRPMPRTFSSPA